jgi:hypothetical protein
VKRILFVCVMVLISTLIITQPASANWYGGNVRTEAYGVSAQIATPNSAPYSIQGGTSSWVSTSNDDDSWVQVGWLHCPAYGYSSATLYIEYRYTGQPSYQWRYGTQAWGTSKNYKLNYVSNAWSFYIDGVAYAAISGIDIPPRRVLAVAEVHDSPTNVLNTWFTSVQWRNSGGTWAYFDQNNKFADSPYTVGGTSNYVYQVYGP